MNYIKSLKFVIVAIIISICTLMPGELFQLYLTQFDGDCYHINFALPKNTEAEQMNSDLIQSAEKNNVIIFKVEKKSVSALESSIDIYAGKNALNHLNKNYQVTGGSFSSLLSGKTVIKTHDFIEAPASAFSDEYTLIGTEEDMYKFKEDLADKYGGSNPKITGQSDKKELTVMYCGAWVMLILLCCLLTLYECAFQKKENFLRMSLGENIRRRILINILTDTAFISILFFVLKLVGLAISKTGFMTGLSFMFFSALLILNSISYLKMSPKSVSSLTGYEKTSRKLLSTNYFLKAVCVIITTIVISSNIACIYEGISYYKQKDFFTQYSDYYSYNCFSDNDGETDDIQHELYRKYLDDMKIFHLCIRTNANEKNILFANINTKEYLTSKIKELGEIDFSKEAYVLIHKGEKLSADELENVKIWAGIKDPPVIYYESSCEVVARTLDADPNTLLQKNPIIVFHNNRDEIPELYLCMLKTDKEELNSFSKDHQLTYSETNMLDYYNQKMLTYKRLIYLNTVLSAIIILIEILVTVTVIRLEYSVNAVLLALKKVLGYSNVNRFSALYRIITLLWIFSVAASVLLSILLKFGNPIYVFAGSIFVLIFDFAIVILGTRKYDRSNIQKILKGGSL